MNDNVASVDQHPIAQGHTLDSGIADAPSFQLFDELIGYRAHMTLGAPCGDDHEIAQRRLARQV